MTDKKETSNNWMSLWKKCNSKGNKWIEGCNKTNKFTNNRWEIKVNRRRD